MTRSPACSVSVLRGKRTSPLRITAPITEPVAGSGVYSVADHDASGPTLYGADVFVSPDHQHHGLAHALTDATRGLVAAEQLWRMVGGSRLPGYAAVADVLPADEYVREVVAGTRIDPVLSAHLKDGWQVVKPIHGYLQHDLESANWAAVIQWVNPECPPPPEFVLR